LERGIAIAIESVVTTMTFILMVLIRILEAMFLVGLAGSTIVLVLTTIEDVKMMLQEDAPQFVDAPPSEA
jgi:hypothetical protein